MRAEDVIGAAALLGACGGSGKVSDWRSLVWLFFSPQGREFCGEKGFPSLDMFRGMKEGVAPYGVHIDVGEIALSGDACVGLVGNTCARLSFSGPERLHRVVLMHGARARIEAGNYAVVSVMNRGGEVEIVKDDTAIIFNE